MFTLNCKGSILSIVDPIVMGIINTTPDSFFAGSRATETDAVLSVAEKMIAEGATILDVGGQSTRPGSEKISADEEKLRVIPAIVAISSRFPGQVISIDSFYASVVKEAVDAGASIVNDVSAGTMDAGMLPLVAKQKIPYVLMHMRGNPQNMQSNTSYTNVTLDVFDSLNKKLHQLIELGINDVIIDPGFGFAKTIEQNFTILQQLEFFTRLERPLLVGLSRKATVYKTLDILPAEALNGTTVLHTIALLNGANILRVHDVRAAMEAIKLVGAVKKKSG
jgi:dihydropteroate synthase